MSVTNTVPTVGALSGSPVLFYPMPTPWPSPEGCENYVYRQSNERLILAWDPAYTSFGSGAASCFLPQQRQWWNQAAAMDPSIALGPTFACPEAYGAVHSTVLESNSAAQTQFTYCCPPNFELGELLPPDERSVGQCTSTAGPGETISYLSINVVTSTETLTGDDGTETLQTSRKTTNIQTSTVVDSDSVATAFAPPINGYNIVVARQATADPSNTGTTPLEATPPPPPGTSDDVSTQSGAVAQPSTISPGAIAGAVVGGVLGLGLLALGAYFVRKRYRYSAAVNRPDAETWDAGTVGGGYGPPHGQVTVSEMSGHTQATELPYGLYAHELPGAK